MRDAAPHLNALEGRTEAALRMVREYIRTGVLRFTVNGRKVETDDVHVVEDPRSLQYNIVIDGEVAATVSAKDLHSISEGPSKAVAKARRKR